MMQGKALHCRGLWFIIYPFIHLKSVLRKRDNLLFLACFPPYPLEMDPSYSHTQDMNA